VLLSFVMVDMAVQLPYMPEELWQPESSRVLAPNEFDLRMMVICPGPVGWLGLWGYLLSLVWLPVAGYFAWRSARAQVPFRRSERVLLMLIPTLIVVVQAVFHLTPLKYGYPLF
jgi:hypothetical protein